MTINSLFSFFLLCPARLHLSLMFNRQRSLHPDPKPPRSSGKLGLEPQADEPSSKPGPVGVAGVEKTLGAWLLLRGVPVSPCP